MQSIIQKLNTLKSVQPSEKLVVEMREEVLSKAPVFCNLEHNYNKKSIFDLSLNNFFASKMAVSFATVIFVLFGGFSASYASKSSLPGDTLYSVKIASENIVLAITSEDKKAEVEIEQAGKRLEELAEISKKPSDINQGEKLKKLVANFEEKVNKAQDGLTKIEDNGKKAQIAKVINVQTEKYTEVLADVNENLTDVVKNDVSEKFASATDSNKKVNFDSLAIMTNEITDDNKGEIISKINDEIDQIESEIEILESELVLSGENSNICGISVDTDDENVNEDEECVEIQVSELQIAIKEAKEEIEKARQSLKDNNLSDAIKSVALIQEVIIEIKDGVYKDNNEILPNTEEDTNNSESEATETDNDSSDENREEAVKSDDEETEFISELNLGQAI